MQAWLEGNPANQEKQESPFFTDNFHAQYELAEREGQKRFASACKHEQVKNGKCCNCLRKVVAA
jgi:hypothetical protein